MPYTEQVVLPAGCLMLRLDGTGYLLNYRDLVVYENGKRRIRGRVTPYAFRSVEQMRYDFENDIQSL